MKKIVLCLFSALAVVACNNGGSSSSSTPATNSNPVVTLLTESNMPTSVTECYDRVSSFTSDISGINNNGVMTGRVQSGPESGCLAHDFLYGNSGNQLQVIPFLTAESGTFFANYPVNDARTSAISSNLITVGLSIGVNPENPSDRHNFATYNTGLIPNYIPSGNFLFGISENGTYITGGTIGPGPTLFNTLIGQQYNLTFNGASFVGALYAASNAGIAVGFMDTIDPDTGENVTNGILCFATSKSCSYILGGPSAGYSAFINTISSNSKWIYGFVNKDGETQIFNVNLETFAVTPLESGFDDIEDPLTQDVVTDTGDVIIKSNSTGKLYLLVPGNITASENSLYSIDDLVTKLNLPAEALATKAYLSPNGNYITFDVSDFGDENLFGVKVYFPNGIANYVSANLTPITTNKILSKKASLPWFKGQNVVK